MSNGVVPKEVLFFGNQCEDAAVMVEMIDVVDGCDFAVSEKPDNRGAREIFTNESNVFAGFTVKIFAARTTIEIKTESRLRRGKSFL